MVRMISYSSQTHSAHRCTCHQRKLTHHLTRSSSRRGDKTNFQCHYCTVGSFQGHMKRTMFSRPTGTGDPGMFELSTQWRLGQKQACDRSSRLLHRCDLRDSQGDRHNPVDKTMQFGIGHMKHMQNQQFAPCWDTSRKRRLWGLVDNDTGDICHLLM